MTAAERLATALADRYRVERELGQGGMATVYLAEDLKHHRPVAIKLLRPELAAALGGERFVREIETTAGLNHPHILGLFDSGQAGDLLYYVMPFVDGESLRARLDRERQLPLEDAVRIAREVAEALGYAHGRGIIHRDIKPENILLHGGHAIVADFGIAKAVTEAGGETLTRTGMAIGTPHYMSPEQATAGPVDARSDLYALGAVLYEMLAGEPPYTGASGQAILAKGMMEPVPRVSVVRQTVSPGLERVVTKALAKSPADRFGSAAALLEGLRASERAGPAEAHRSGWSSRTRAGAIALVATVVAVGGYLWSREAPATAPPELALDRIAVAPFSVNGASDLAYLGHGMVDLISTKLDGAGGLVTVSPRAIIAVIDGERIDPADTTAGERVARRLGAGRYVTGSVTEAGGRIQLTAFMHRTAAPGSAPFRTVAEGRTESLFELIDSLARKLLNGVLPDSVARLEKLATTVKTSLPALKEYLRGEQLIAAGQYRDGYAAYDRAIAQDTGFALAYYRKSLVSEWIDAEDVRSAADQASERADRLSPRDRSVVAALRMRRRGESSAAERAYLTHLHKWPDEVEALVQMGEILFHDNPRRGRPLDEARPYFEAALRLEPANANARIHLVRLHALSGEIDSLAADIRQFEQGAAALAVIGREGELSERVFETQAILAYATQDTAAQRDLARRLRGAPWYYWFSVAHGVARFARDAAGAQTILEQRNNDEAITLVQLAGTYVTRGQHERLRQMLNELPGGRTPMWDLFEGYLLTSGALAPDTARMVAVLERVRRADPAELRRTAMVPPYEDLTVEFHRYERDHQVALLLIQLGRLKEAERAIASLRAAPPMEALGNLQIDAPRELDAELQLARGDSARALATLRSISYEAPHGATYHAIADGPRPRFLRAELELARGDTTVARALYRGFDESWSPWDIYHRAIAYQRLGEIAEAEGKSAEAILQYNRLLELWQDADPAFADRCDAIKRRRDALLRATG
ncbi:MAG: protein kinase [Gemmatimonadales bacterium]